MFLIVISIRGIRRSSSSFAELVDLNGISMEAEAFPNKSSSFAELVDLNNF